jgi:hypothetical protein
VVWGEVEVAWRRDKVVVVMLTMKPSFTEAFHAFESMRGVMYAHDITKRDQADNVNIERLLFSLKRKSATEQLRINDFISLVYIFLFSKHIYANVTVFILFISAPTSIAYPY